MALPSLHGLNEIRIARAALGTGEAPHPGPDQPLDPAWLDHTAGFTDERDGAGDLRGRNDTLEPFTMSPGRTA